MVLVSINVAARIGVAILTELSGYAVDVCFHCLLFVYVPISEGETRRSVPHVLRWQFQVRREPLAHGLVRGGIYIALWTQTLQGTGLVRLDRGLVGMGHGSRSPQLCRGTGAIGASDGRLNQWLLM